LNRSIISRARKLIAKESLVYATLPAWTIIIIVAMGAVAGCGVLRPREQTAVAVHRDRLRQIKRIVVLPFYNLSERVDAEIIVGNILISELSRSGRFSPVKYGDVQEFLRQQKIQSTETATTELLKALRDRFSAQAVMLGTIITYREWSPERGDKQPAMVEISARLLDCETGQTLWFARQKRDGQREKIIFDFGESRFCSQLVQKVVREFVDSL